MNTVSMIALYKNAMQKQALSEMYNWSKDANK